MTTSRRIVLALAAGAAVSLAACSNSGSGAAQPPASHSPSASVAVAAPHAGSSGAGTVIDPCKVLTIAQVQPLITYRLTGTKSAVQQTTLQGALHECNFASSETDSEISVGVEADKGAAEAFADYQSEADHPIAVPGVGDQAFRSTDDPDVSAEHGGVFCTIVVTDPGDVPGAARLYDENGHHTDIGAAAFNTIAAAVGTLCNRIFGTGNTTPDLSALATATAPGPTDNGGLPTDFQVPTDFATS